MRGRLLLVGLVATSAGAGCGGGGETQAIPRDRIVLERGMGGVRLGMAASEGRAVLGAPHHVSHFSGSDTGKPLLSWRYRPSRLFVDLEKKDGRWVASMVTANAARPRTPGGLGVGSTEDDVKRSIRRANCFEERPRVRWCTHGGALGLGPETVFELHR